MSKYTFEDFLMDKHAEDYRGVKDLMIDDFARWVQGLEIEDFIDYGDEFAKKQSENLLEACKWAFTQLEGQVKGRAVGTDLLHKKNTIEKLEQAIKKAESN